MAQPDELRLRLAEWVRGYGLDCRTASSGGAARQALAYRSVHGVVIADVRGGTGAALRLALQLRKVTGKPLLIAATGYASTREYLQYRDAGFDAVLTWPLTKDGLRARLLAGGLDLSDETARRHEDQRAEALALFGSELREDIGRLERAVDKGVAEDIARWAHRIKGASVMFGRNEMADVAALFEAKREDPPEQYKKALHGLVKRLQAMFHEDFGAPGSDPPTMP